MAKATKRWAKLRRKDKASSLDRSQKRYESRLRNRKAAASVASKRQDAISPWRYAERSESLKQLGFASYTDYLESGLWKSIRMRVLARDRRRCVDCGKVATEIHHSRYDIIAMAGSKLSELHSVCRACHQTRHTGREAVKRPRTPEKLSEACPKCGVQKKRASLCKKCRGEQWMIIRGGDGYKTFVRFEKKPDG